jgi:hypothetical protein
LSAVEDIRIKLETRLHEVEAEIESLRAGLGALEAQAAAESSVAASPDAVDSRPAPTPIPTPRPRRPRARVATNGHRPAPRGPSRAELEEMLAQAGGPEAVELARETGADYGVVLARIRELEQAGRPRG